MKKIFFIPFLLFTFILSSLSVFACSCIMPGTLAEEVERADAVFVGIVTSVGTGTVVGGSSDSFVFPDVEVTFAVQEYWKGAVSETVVIHTGMGGGDCGFPFEEGKTYLVYAYADEKGDLHANICSRTEMVPAEEDGVFSGVERDIYELRSLYESSFYESSSQESFNSLNLFVFVFILLLLSFVVFSSYKNKKYSE